MIHASSRVGKAGGWQTRLELKQGMAYISHVLLLNSRRHLQKTQNDGMMSLMTVKTTKTEYLKFQALARGAIPTWYNSREYNGVMPFTVTRDHGNSMQSAEDHM